MNEMRVTDFEPSMGQGTAEGLERDPFERTVVPPFEVINVPKTRSRPVRRRSKSRLGELDAHFMANLGHYEKAFRENCRKVAGLDRL